MAANRWRCWRGFFILGVLAALTGCRQEPEVIKIGVVAPFEGPYRAVGTEAITAIRDVVREWTRNPLVEGFAFNVIAYDDKGMEDMAASAAMRIISDPDIDVVIGHWLTQTSSRAAPIYRQAGISFITSSPDEIESIFNISPTRSELGDAIDDAILSGIIEDQLFNHCENKPDLGADESNQSVGFIACDFEVLAESENPLTDPESPLYFITGNPGIIGASIGTVEEDRTQVTTENDQGVIYRQAYLAAWKAIELELSQRGFNLSIPVLESLQFSLSGRAREISIRVVQWRNGELVPLTGEN